MRVFVAGATGAIGRPLVRQLVEAGHEVTGMTRSHERAGELRAQGVEATVADALDASAVVAAVTEAAPEVVVHQLTALPRAMDLRRAETFESTNRLRREGTRNLVAASLAAGARRLVAQSIAFLYAPEGDSVKDEQGRPFTDAPAPFDGAVAALLDLERQVTGEERLEGLVLRYGFFYGPGTAYASDGSMAAEVRRRRFPIVGRGDGTFSFIHVEDSAGATVRALGSGSRGIYNVVDDEPAPMREWLPAYAEALGARPPLRAPRFLARLVAGKVAAVMATELRGASNAKARRELGWTPRYASWRQGFREALG